MDAFAVDNPAVKTQQRPDPAVAVAGMMPHELVHAFHELLLLVMRAGVIPLGRTGLIEYRRRPDAARRRRCAAIALPPSVASSGSEFPLGHLLEHGDVEGLLADELFEPPVLLSELHETFGVGRLHPAALLPLTVQGSLADAHVLDDLADRAARREHGIGLTQLVDDLFRSVSFAFHRRITCGSCRRLSGLS